MRHLSFLIVGLATLLPASAQTPATIGRIEKLDPGLDKFIADETKIEVLAGGFTWTEGPVWISDDAGGHLLFSDIPRNSIFRWSPARGVELFMRPSGYTGPTTDLNRAATGWHLIQKAA